MRRNLIFFVTEESWAEHFQAGIAAINDPFNVAGTHGNSKRQVAISEVSGIRPGDRLFFKVGAAGGNARLIGVYRATSPAYYNSNPLFPGAVVVNATLPFRVNFEVEKYFPEGVQMQFLWHLRDSGRLWNLQQSRGDIVGRHACVSIAEDEAEAIIELLEANNPSDSAAPNLNAQRQLCPAATLIQHSLPVDLAERNGGNNLYPGRLHYEAALQGQLHEALANRRFAAELGNYTDFISFPTTGSGTEIDLLCYKRVNGRFLWYNVIEMKADQFSEGELQKLIDYERWISRSRAHNSLQVHSTGIGYRFDQSVMAFVRNREAYRDRPIKLLKYQFDAANQTLSLTPV